ncbi:uncharacterized protein N7484_000678 [Penicillium longicatenatum]|uniref:uncharacterized protein n=1 Tax=Penicillium longicatenatum TaxID=1561947 RepID=UPI002548BBB4|nr:uncharacterized protein N7484_000678 [Penicillium longicatenatum]KAJ5661306.1 hypothetical protein N7484_000678 [Penicillium longicatenatum]
MMKRKAEKQQGAGPVSAIAARKARQQAQNVTASKVEVVVEAPAEPPSKRPRRSLEADQLTEMSGTESKGRQTRSAKNQEVPIALDTTTGRPKKATQANPSKSEPEVLAAQEELENEDSEEDIAGGPEEMDEDEVASVAGDADGYESPTETTELQNFPLSKARLNKNSIVYADDSVLCIRIKEKTNLALIGQYDLWVKRGVVSLMGAKLHPSPRVYRVYAPSTHSLPIIKCVSGVDGEAEVQIKSCNSGLSRLRDVSPLYQKIWNGQNTTADKATLKGASKNSRRSFSVLYTSGEDPLKRHLRPLHLDKKWSASMKALSQRQGRLRVLVCGPKASGKSTFSRYLLNHVLSPAPETENGFTNTDGVAFLDLDPGQPEFAPMGQVYLAHLRAPFFGPPFTHPSLDSRDGQILRAHHIGATSPKEDSDHYALATIDLLDHYHSLLAQYPQCPLIVNYPGWIFGQGLEVATWLVKCLGLSDVVYMSEKGPQEVVEPLRFAANEARVPMTILPSQPTDFVSRSSAQLRSMQIQSYFHSSHISVISSPIWSETPLSRTRPMAVDYAGSKQGILGIMVMGSQISPDMLREVLEGAVVGLVAIESPSAIMAALPTESAKMPADNSEDESDDHMDMDSEEHQLNSSDYLSPAESIVRTPEGLPYFFTGSGSCTPLNPKASNCLGLALIRSVDVKSQKIELSTPVPSSRIREAIEQDHSLMLVRGQLDSPNWAVSEEYYAARAAERRYQQVVVRAKKGGESAADTTRHNKTLALLRDRIRRASNVPWMKVVEDNSRHQREANARREKSLWKLRKKAYPGSDSEPDW